MWVVIVMPINILFRDCIGMIVNDLKPQLEIAITNLLMRVNPYVYVNVIESHNFM